MSTHPFLQSEEFLAVTEKAFFRSLLADVPADSPIIFDLTFHGAFAKRMFDIIQREGPSVQGFERMQQSFLESVDKIRGVLADLQEKDVVNTSSFIEKIQEASIHLKNLIGDLALMKNWQMKSSDTKGNE